MATFYWLHFIGYISFTAIPKISNLTVSQNLTTAVLNCHYTGHLNLMIMWHTPSGVMTFVEESSLAITNLGPEAAGVYQCYVTYREDHLSIPVDYETTNNTSVVSVFVGIGSSSHTS